MFGQKTLHDYFTSTPREETKVTAGEKKISNIHQSEKRAFMTVENKKCYDKKIQWKGYLIVATNNFTEYSVINTYPRLDKTLKNVILPGTVVGSAAVDENSALTHIEVNENSRRQGIGSELIRFIKNACPQFTIFGGNERNSRYRLTEEGAALVRHCLKEKILKTDQVITNFVPASPSYEY